MKARAELDRDAQGIFHIDGDAEVDAYWGLGFAHATDRALQMMMMRILGQGRAAELLDGADETVAIDTFFRRMNWRAPSDETMSETSNAICVAYVDGINAAWAGRVPWELKLLGVPFEPWTVDDSIMLARMVSYLTLAQSQGEVERLFIQMVQANLPMDKLQALFGEAIAGVDVELLKKIKLGERFVPPEVVWQGAAPRVMASNNWVVSPRKSKTGGALLASDPHLEVNRLPSVWYEVVMRAGTRWAITATMPGLPGMVIGRTNDLSWGPTYTFMDTIDSWVEQCREGKYRRGEDTWMAFRERKETIVRKGKTPVEVVFLENGHGVLDGDPYSQEYLLTTQWTMARGGPRSIDAMLELWRATNVEEGMTAIGRMENAFSWVLADTAGNIGFQMSGLMPKRREGVTGFLPLPGWDSANDWQGFVALEDLPRCYNPECGWFATANQDLNEHGNVAPLNMNQGPYRAQRIGAVLDAKSDLTVEDMFALQFDTKSVQAEAFMVIIRPLLPDTSNASILAQWDLQYVPDSRGADVFERFYRALLDETFGKGGVGTQVIDFLADETGLFADFFINFDAILLGETSPWFGERTREALLRAALDRALAEPARRWGDRQKLVLSHMLFGGKLPRWLGFDRGPIELRGGRATPHQGQIFRGAGRDTSFGPSIRFVTDMSTSDVHTRLCGGVTDRRFSKWYCNELQGWLRGTYKKLAADR